MSGNYIYIISTDDPLLMMEACDLVIEASRENGMSERNIIDANEKFNWNDVLASSDSLSLFAEIKLTDIRFTKSPNKAAQDSLTTLAETANVENQLLIRLPKLEKRQKNTKWYKAISQNAKVQELWAPKPQQFLQWIEQRCGAENIKMDAEATQFLAEQTEGNLLAAKQEIDKLKLLYAEETINLDKIKKIASDNTRYSVFLCLDEALSGHGARAVRMLKKFEQESIVPISILVNLTREVELCKNTAIAVAQGQNVMQVLAKSYLWDSKKRLIAGAVNRLPSGVWQRLAIRCAFLDRLIKGQETGNIWQELELCLWMISGQRIWGKVS